MFLQKFYKLIFGTNLFLRISAAKRVCQIRFKHFCCQNLQFLWCIEIDIKKKMKKEAEFYLCRSSWNVNVPSFYVIFRVFSCIEFFIWFLRKILTNILTLLQRQRVEKRHCVVTTIQLNDHYIISLIKINLCTWHYSLSLLTEALKLFETKEWFLLVFPFIRLSLRHLKIFDDDCPKSSAINPVLLFSL